MEAVPRVAFGVIADIQFADADDGHDFGGSRRRYYRHSLRLLRDAVRAWAAESPPIDFVLQLGDSIDGLNARRGEAEGALRQVLEALGRLPVPVHHAWGNHEFYNFSRARLAQSGLCSRPAGGAAGPPDGLCQAYHCSPAARLRLVVLDAYDLSVLGRDPDSPRYQESLRLLREKNTNEDLNSPAGLKEPQFVAFNGGFSQAQLNWFDEVLKFSDENQEKVVVMDHLPIHPDASDRVCLAWNYEAALSVIHSHRALAKPLAALCSHKCTAMKQRGRGRPRLQQPSKLLPEDSYKGTNATELHQIRIVKVEKDLQDHQVQPCTTYHHAHETLS